MWVGVLWQATSLRCLPHSLKFFFFWYNIPVDVDTTKQLTVFISDGLNISSSQTQPQLPDNFTIQSFLEAYVDNYMGGFTMTYQKILLKIRPLWLFALVTILVFIEDGLNLSSSQLNTETPDNRTIQNFVEDYVDEYIGWYTLVWKTNFLHLLSKIIQ